MRLYKFCILIIISLFGLHNSFAQKQKEVKKINLLHADIGKFDNISGKNAQRLIGHVKAEHDGSLLWCDSAYLYANNSMDAFGNVHININDSLDLYGDQVFYDGNTKIAEFHDNVKLVDQKAILYTDILIYNRITDIGKYFVWGRIEDSVNVLTSKKGYYYNQLETVFFKDSVVVVNPDYVMKSDTLKYNTKTEVVHFLGPTTIEGDSSFMFAERGQHHTKTKESRLSQNAFIQNKSNTLQGDSIFYSEERGLAKVFDHVVMTDTTNDVLVTGGFAIYNKADLFAYVIDSAQAIFVDESDSVFMHADTLMLRLDSLENPEYLLAFRSMKFFGEDMQGMADSLSYSFNDSTLRMFQKPILWFDENQISSERIDLISENGSLDSAAFQKNVFLVSQDTVDPQFFNQISGKNMYAWFKDDDLRKIYISDQTETIYFLWEEDGTPIGMNKMKSKDMLVFLKDQQLETMTYISAPEAKLTPTPLVKATDTKLPGFIWRMEWRPRKRADIFIKNSDIEIKEEIKPQKRGFQDF